MRLRILLPKVNPEAITVPTRCVYPSCSRGLDTVGTKSRKRKQDEWANWDSKRGANIDCGGFWGGEQASAPRFCLRCPSHIWSEQDELKFSSCSFLF